MKSMLFLAAHKAFSMSSGRIEETDSDVPGRLIPCLERIVPLTLTMQRTESRCFSTTSIEIMPSASITEWPTANSSINFV